MRKEGFPPNRVKQAIEACWVLKNVFVDESESVARELAHAAFGHEQKHLRRSRRLHNRIATATEVDQSLRPHEKIENASIIGTPSQVTEQIAELESIGVFNLMLKMNVGGMDTTRARSAMRLFAKRVIPSFSRVPDTR